MSTTVIISVTTETAPERLHPDDASVAGDYGVILGDGPGEHPDQPRRAPEGDEDPREEAALDVFHDRVGIAVVDDFVVDVRIAHDDDDIPEDVQWL